MVLALGIRGSGFRLFGFRVKGGSTGNKCIPLWSVFCVVYSKA